LNGSWRLEQSWYKEVKKIVFMRLPIAENIGSCSMSLGADLRLPLRVGLHDNKWLLICPPRRVICLMTAKILQRKLWKFGEQPELKALQIKHHRDLLKRES
jgi:hypothetical protein